MKNKQTIILPETIIYFQTFTFAEQKKRDSSLSVIIKVDYQRAQKIRLDVGLVRIGGAGCIEYIHSHQKRLRKRRRAWMQ